MRKAPGAAGPVPDPCLCPLCGQGNRCAVQAARDSGVAQPPCWCMASPIAPAVLARVPAAARGLVCVCAGCASAADAPG